MSTSTKEEEVVGAQVEEKKEAPRFLYQTALPGAAPLTPREESLAAFAAFSDPA